MRNNSAMKIAVLAPANSIHTQRWVQAFAARGYKITLFTQHDGETDCAWAGIDIVRLPFQGNPGYFANGLVLRKRLAALKPDLLHTHYASGYGTTATLTGFQPSLLSVWGSDVFDFPYESWWKAKMLWLNLNRATRLASTSQIMAKQVERLAPRLEPAFVTPFGIDCEMFAPEFNRDPQFITIGTVKTLLPKYGIDTLIQAFALVLADQRLDQSLLQRLRLLLVGGGDQYQELKALTETLGIETRVTFAGAVPYRDVPRWLNQLDVYVAASRLDSESFGVAVAEASACGIPVVTSDAGGLPEVVQNGETGFIVPRENPAALAEAIKSLIATPDLRRNMGEKGRQYILKNYEWTHCVDLMETAYKTVIEAT